MNSWIYFNILVFAVVVVLTGFVIPKILLIAFRKKLFDEVDPRKIHKGVIPRLGGIAFFPAILFAISLVVGIISMVKGVNVFMLDPANVVRSCFILCSTITLFLVGIADDLIGIRYRGKFLAQIFSAALMIISGVMISDLHGFLGIEQMPLWISALLTGLLIIFITNAMNLIDGIDGLASGLSGMACAFYGFICFNAGYYLFSMAAFATLGALIPFFYYNVFGDPKKQSKIFMGDTGSLTIGMILSVLSLRVNSIPDTSFVHNSAVLAFSPLLIPCLDVVRVYIHRLRAHRNPFLPDKTHIHHKILALGVRQRVAMPLIVASSLIFTAFNYAVSPYVNITLIFAIDLAVWLLANKLLTNAIRRREKRLNTVLYE